MRIDIGSMVLKNGSGKGEVVMIVDPETVVVNFYGRDEECSVWDLTLA